MSKENKSFENIPWQVIKNYLAPLARVFDRHPQRKTALALHLVKYPDISRNTASKDLDYAMRLNNSYHTL